MFRPSILRTSFASRPAFSPTLNLFKRNNATFAKLTLIGYVGNDLEPETLENDKQVLRYSIAVNPLRNRNKEDQPPRWFRVECWNERSFDFMTKYCPKGSLVYVECQPVPQVYEKEDGTKAYSIKFYQDTFKILKSKGQEESS
ncbi:Rim1p, partial [Ascoidea rubescens DSM 1968]